MKTDKQNIVMLSVLSLLEGLQLLVIAAFIQSFFPIETHLRQQLLAQVIDYLRPERETLLYRGFIVSVLVVQAAFFAVFRSKLDSPALNAKLKSFLVTESIATFLLLFASFKCILYGFTPALKIAFAMACMAAVVFKCAWFKGADIAKWFCALREKVSLSVVFQRALETAFFFFVFCSVFIPNRADAVAAIYARDKFYHFDSFIMVPGWAALKGLTLNVDILSQYGVGLPLIISNLASLLGFDYSNVLLVFTVLAAAYFILCYVFVKAWLKSVILAMAAVLLAMKFQMFWFDANDIFVWKYPSVSVVRYLPDMVFFMLILAHQRRKEILYLLLAGFWAGAALFYVADAGVYLTVTYAFYLCLLVLLRDMRVFVYAGKEDILKAAALFLLPAASAFVFFFAYLKGQMFQASYWEQNFEFIRLFSQGHGALPVYDGLEKREFFAFFRGISMGLVYILTLAVCLPMLYFNKMKDKAVMVAVLSVYGLCSYHYWVCRSAPFSYLPVCIPAVLIVVFWAEHFVSQTRQDRQFQWTFTLLVLSWFALLTTHGYLRYPHVFNLKKYDSTADGMNFVKQFATGTDAMLIQALTGKEERVALISSHDIAFLIDADRAPFFPYLPLINSRPLSAPDFGGLRLVTRRQFERTMQLLEDKKPQYLFFESKLILGQIPPVYYQYYPELARLRDYARKHYAPFKAGLYLMALKRND